MENNKRKTRRKIEHAFGTVLAEICGGTRLIQLLFKVPGRCKRIF